MSKGFAVFFFAFFGVGCAMSEDVGDDKSAVNGQGAAGAGGADTLLSAGGASAGAAGQAGAAGEAAGGAAGAAPSATGGAAGEGGEGGGAAGAPPMCESGQKLCGASCEEKSFENGCGSAGCTSCNKPPANSKGVCNGALCDFECLPGYVADGFACKPQGSSGSGGSGGSGGSSAGSGGGSSGGSGGGLNVCVAPCTPSDPASQFLCVAACISKGGMGLCAPALNCCVCG